MALKTTYYGLFGVGETAPSGLFRELRDDEEGKLSYELFNRKGKWEKDPSLCRHLMGYSDEAEILTAAEALAYMEKATGAGT